MFAQQTVGILLGQFGMAVTNRTDTVTVVYKDRLTDAGVTGAVYPEIAAPKIRGSAFALQTVFAAGAMRFISASHYQNSTSNAFCAWYAQAEPIRPLAKAFVSGTVVPSGTTTTGHEDTTVTFKLAPNFGSSAGTDYYYIYTGSASDVSKTTHNGQLSGIVDAAGFGQLAIGYKKPNTAASYLLKTSVAISSITAGNTIATDTIGAAGDVNYDVTTAALGAIPYSISTSACWVNNAASALFSNAVSGLDWQASGAFIPATGASTSVANTAFGSDGVQFYINVTPLSVTSSQSATTSYGYYSPVFCAVPATTYLSAQWNGIRCMRYL